MTRFWTRIIQPFQKKKTKKLPVIVFDEPPSSHLKEYYMCGHHLVRIDRLEKAYHRSLLLQQKQKKYWIDPFVQIWYAELDRVCQQSQDTLSVLNTQLEDLSHILCAVSSPLKNRDRHSLRKAQQFITTCLTEWDSYRNCKSSSITNKQHKSMVVGDRQQQLLETALLQHPTNSESREYQTYYQGLEDRIQQEFGSNKGDPRLRQCIRQVHRLEQDLYLYRHYISSQFRILGRRIPPEQEQYHEMKWQQQFDLYQALETNFKTVLKSSSPPDRADVTCAVCLDILHEPTTLTTCHHTFCRGCIQRMYCAQCHRERAKTLHRISHLLKPVPLIYCTCRQTMDGDEPSVLENQHCPLCRTMFIPDQCTADVALEKFISLYFPKPRYEEEEDKKRKDGGSIEDVRLRRRSQISAGKFYSKMQRWSHQWGDDDCSEQDTPPVPTIPHSARQRAQNDILLIARRSWVF